MVVMMGCFSVVGAMSLSGRCCCYRSCSGSDVICVLSSICAMSAVRGCLRCVVSVLLVIARWIPLFLGAEFGWFSCCCCCCSSD